MVVGRRSGEELDEIGDCQLSEAKSVGRAGMVDAVLGGGLGDEV